MLLGGALLLFLSCAAWASSVESSDKASSSKTLSLGVASCKTFRPLVLELVGPSSSVSEFSGHPVFSGLAYANTADMHKLS